MENVLLLAFTEKRTKEEIEAREKIDKKLNDIQFEFETGLPAIARTMPSADQMVGGR